MLLWLEVRVWEKMALGTEMLQAWMSWGSKRAAVQEHEAVSPTDDCT